MTQGTCESSHFPGYLASDPGDGAPQVESNGIVAVTLQKMLVQVDGPRILIFPAFKKGIDVDARLHVPGWGSTRSAAELRVVVKGGKLLFLGVLPDSRRADVVILALQ